MENWIFQYLQGLVAAGVLAYVILLVALLNRPLPDMEIRMCRQFFNCKGNKRKTLKELRIRIFEKR